MSLKRANSPSLAVWLTAWYAGATFTLLVVATVYLYWATVTHLDAEDILEFRRVIQRLERVLQTAPLNLAAAQTATEVEDSAEPIFVRLLKSDNSSIVETAGMTELMPASKFTSLAVGTPAKFSVRNVPAANGRFYLSCVVRVNDYRLQLALDHQPEALMLAAYRKRIYFTLGAALAVCVALGYIITWRGLRPLSLLASAMKRTGSTRLTERVQAAGYPAELAQLADAFNDMLVRLDESFQRLMRYSADIAHELRTPINNLRGEAEVALGKARSPEEYREVISSCLEECQQVSKIIDTLLFLSRAENPGTQIRRELLDVKTELAGIREFYEPAFTEAGIHCALEVPENISAKLDRTLFQRAVSNLLENAAAHTPRDGKIILSAVRHNGVLRVNVTDTGCGVAANDLPHILDRFYRSDRSRSHRGGQLGLGLSIVKGVTELHGGRVEISSEVGKGTSVTLILPA